MIAVACEKCGQNAVPDSGSRFGWCEICRHWTGDTSYGQVSAEYQSSEYAAHNIRAAGSFAELKQQWTTNIHIIKQIKSQGRLLDIGFLEGAGMSAFSDAGFACWGFDVSEKSRQQAIANGVDETRLVIADAWSPSLLSIRFDVVTVREVIEHVPAPVDLLKSARASLFDDGIIQVQTPRHHATVRFWDTATHLRVYSTSSLLLDCEAAGFELMHLLQWPGGVCMTLRKADF